MTTSLRKMMTCSAPFSLLSSAASLLGAVESHEGRRAHRRNHYLTPAELLPDPRIDTPWQRLWESQNDRAFVTPMGVDVTTFHDELACPFPFPLPSPLRPFPDTTP